MIRATPAADATQVAPAGFWRRYAAWSIDWLLLAPVLALLLIAPMTRAWAQALAVNALVQDWVLARVTATGGNLPAPQAMAAELLADPVLASAVQGAIGQLTTTLTLVLMYLAGGAALYFIGFEGSPWRATPGKALLRLQVCALDGGPPGFARAALRFFAGGLSWLLLNLGHALVAWREDRRALHDLIAGTQVLATGEMPPWARHWLLAQAALLLAVFLGALLRFLWALVQLVML